jgi:hypothetical protein
VQFHTVPNSDDVSIKILVLNVPLIHILEMFLIAMDDNLGTLLELSELAVREDAGELEDGRVQGVQAGHLHVQPEERRLKCEHVGWIRFVFVLVCF